MAAPDPTPTSSFMDLTDDQFLALINTRSTFKQRSHDTYHTIHLPELNLRLNLGLDLPPPPQTAVENDPFASTPNLANSSPIHTIYLGSSMLERLKTTGSSTHLGQLADSGNAWNAGCGGDKNENVLYRFSQGLYTSLKTAQSDPNTPCDIKLWVLSSGTNNLHPKRGFRENDVQSWKMVVQACLGIAPRSRVLACDVFKRKDIGDGLVEEGNEMLRRVVEEVNGEIGRGQDGKESVVWVEARELIKKEMLVDHVHLDEEGYRVWDGGLGPWIKEVLETEGKE